ncbi:glutamate-1-semialdehyde 2,1-aminomutase 2 [Actinomycetota bacterium]|nr:glutamate-1-semialdehyde 2,1-aminomutase 2 [Actinomycetota bacterium]
MITQTNHRETFRFVPSTSTPVSPERVAQLLKAEWELFTKQTGKSAEESKRALKSLPMGVTSSFQHWDPYPISIVSAKGAWMTDVDGRQLLDLSMGFGAMLAGHLNPIIVEEVKKALKLELSLSPLLLFQLMLQSASVVALELNRFASLTLELNQQCMPCAQHALQQIRMQ